MEIIDNLGEIVVYLGLAIFLVWWCYMMYKMFKCPKGGWHDYGGWHGRKIAMGEARQRYCKKCGAEDIIIVHDDNNIDYNKP